MRRKNSSQYLGGKRVTHRNGCGNWQNDSKNRDTHKEEDGFKRRFIDDVAAVKERAILEVGVDVSLEDMQRYFPSVDVVVVEVS